MKKTDLSIWTVKFNKTKHYVVIDGNMIHYYKYMCCCETILFKAVMLSKRHIHISKVRKKFHIPKLSLVPKYQL